jgi:hypothetical protein
MIAYVLVMYLYNCVLVYVYTCVNCLNSLLCHLYYILYVILYFSELALAETSLHNLKIKNSEIMLDIEEETEKKDKMCEQLQLLMDEMYRYVHVHLCMCILIYLFTFRY